MQNSCQRYKKKTSLAFTTTPCRNTYKCLTLAKNRQRNHYSLFNQMSLASKLNTILKSLNLHIAEPKPPKSQHFHRSASKLIIFHIIIWQRRRRCRLLSAVRSCSSIFRHQGQAAAPGEGQYQNEHVYHEIVPRLTEEGEVATPEVQRPRRHTAQHEGGAQHTWPGSGQVRSGQVRLACVK